MVVLVILARALEARVTNQLYDLSERLDYIPFWYSNSEPVVGPVNDLYLVLGPEVLQWIHNSRLHLEVFGQVFVLYNAKESFSGEYPHLNTLCGGGAEAPPTSYKRLPKGVCLRSYITVTHVAEPLPELHWRLAFQ